MHQSKMKCLQPTSNVLRTEKPGETKKQNLLACDEEEGRNTITDVSEETKHVLCPECLHST